MGPLHRPKGPKMPPVGAGALGPPQCAHAAELPKAVYACYWKGRIAVCGWCLTLARPSKCVNSSSTLRRGAVRQFHIGLYIPGGHQPKANVDRTSLCQTSCAWSGVPLSHLSATLILEGLRFPTPCMSHGPFSGSFGSLWAPWILSCLHGPLGPLDRTPATEARILATESRLLATGCRILPTNAGHTLTRFCVFVPGPWI